MEIQASKRQWVAVRTVVLFVGVAIGMYAAGKPANEGKALPPPARTDNVRETIHGVGIVDPYRWLEDQESPETRAWIDAENKFTDSIIKPLPGRDSLKKQLSGLLKVTSFSLPRERGGR